MNEDQQSKNVFLIEDDLSLNSSIKDILEFKQYHVKTYTTANDFLEDFDSNIAPAVVVSDMMLPGLSGIDLQVKIVENFRKIPIIFISGESTLSQCISAMKMGALDFLLKPFEFKQLIDAIERGMDIDKLFMRSIIKRNELDINLQKLSPREQEVFHL